MPAKKLPKPGERFGAMTVNDVPFEIRPYKPPKHPRTWQFLYVNVRCDCGKDSWKNHYNLKRFNSTCGLDCSLRKSVVEENRKQKAWRGESKSVANYAANCSLLIAKIGALRT